MCQIITIPYVEKLFAQGFFVIKMKVNCIYKKHFSQLLAFFYFQQLKYSEFQIITPITWIHTRESHVLSSKITKLTGQFPEHPDLKQFRKFCFLYCSQHKYYIINKSAKFQLHIQYLEISRIWDTRLFLLICKQDKL